MCSVWAAVYGTHFTSWASFPILFKSHCLFRFMINSFLSIQQSNKQTNKQQSKKGDSFAHMYYLCCNVIHFIDLGLWFLCFCLKKKVVLLCAYVVFGNLKCVFVPYKFAASNLKEEHNIVYHITLIWFQTCASIERIFNKWKVQTNERDRERGKESS